MKTTVSIVFCLFFGTAGCATTPTLSPMQVRAITTRTVEGSYENIFRSTLTILQDNGYIIKNTDMQTGLIVANVDRDAMAGKPLWIRVLASSGDDKSSQLQSTVVEVSVTVNKISDTASELRMNIQETDYSRIGGKMDVRQIREPAVYNSLFNDITVEIKRREALGR